MGLDPIPVVLVGEGGAQVPAELGPSSGTAGQERVERAGAVLLVVIMARIEGRASARDEEIRAQLAPAPMPIPDAGSVPTGGPPPGPMTSVPRSFSPATSISQPFAPIEARHSGADPDGPLAPPPPPPPSR